MSAFIIQMPEGWEPGEGLSLTELETIWRNAQHAREVNSGLDVCWGERQAYDFHSRKPVKLFAVEDK